MQVPMKSLALLTAASISMVTAGIAATQNASSSPAQPSTPVERLSYDPLPPSWNIQLNRPGWLSVGAQYCTQSGHCKIVGEGPDGLPPIPLKDGGTAPPSIGCRENPDYPPCISARVPVQLLVRSQAGATIFKLEGRNYAVGGLEWAFERPDGTAIGGPIMVENPDGELLPLHYALRGMTKAAHDRAVRQIDEQRRRAVGGILKIRRERCDELVSVTKQFEGSFVATCLNGGKQTQYTEGVSGLP